MSPDRAVALLAGFAGRRVAVVGDLMLDRYIFGSASRISPEAPVPVVRVRERRQALGGAANVLHNLGGLGATPLAYGVIGEDAPGDELLRECADLAIDVSGIVRERGRRTIVKTRLIADHQQVARIDEEDDVSVGTRARNEVLRKLQDGLAAGHVDAIILEDYNKGLLTTSFARRVLELASAAGVPVALDPHPGNPLRVKGLTLMTPNRAEAFAMAGIYYRAGVLPLADDRALLRVGATLRRRWSPEHLLVTLGGQGMALFGRLEQPFHVPTVAKEVFDVSGAGDTVIATYTLALLAGASDEEAAVIANHAAGIVVGKVGTVPIAFADLRASLHG